VELIPLNIVHGTNGYLKRETHWIRISIILGIVSVSKIVKKNKGASPLLTFSLRATREKPWRR